MTIIGDAVAGANFELSEPLAAHTYEPAANAEPERTVA
jgi:uroporphyrin-III C-methyltransferase/precorrin-2 dehydrogenase/sirohydrochlorin ferrochelatase